jgi:hypothetical protein
MMAFKKKPTHIAAITVTETNEPLRIRAEDATKE